MDYQNAVASWMEDETGIQIPPDSRLMEFSAGVEYGKLLKYNMPDQTLDSFILNYSLSSILPEDARTLLIIDMDENWENEKLTGQKDYYLLEDCKKGLRWTILVERNQGLCWFEVIHADFSGHVPECEKEK
ncbi:hypothetical protein [Halocola ammonii]